MNDEYPFDGRSASATPGVVAELLSLLPNHVPWEWFIVPLNSRFDRFVSRRGSKLVQILFGWRPTRRERTI